jgi:signal transduction histidine kinase
MTERRGYSLSARLALITAIWSAIALLVIGLILVELFRDHIEKDFDDRVAEDLVNLVRGTVAFQRGQVGSFPRLGNPVYDKPFSGWVWQVRRGDSIIQQSQSLGPLVAGIAEKLRVPGQGAEPTDFMAPGDILSRGLSRQIVLGEAEPNLTFSVAGPRSDIDDDLAYFSQLLIYSLAIFAVLLFVTSLLLTRILLTPVTRLKAAVREMRDGNSGALDQRWPTELVPVVDELNGLNVHIAQSLDRSRNATSDLAHSLKTPLSIIRQAAEIADAATARPIVEQVDKISQSVDWHLTYRRASGSRRGRVHVEPVVNDVAFALSRLFADRRIEINVTVDPAAHFLGDPEDLHEMLGNVAENACKWARSSVAIVGSISGGQLTLRIDDDGDGFPDLVREEVFRRGVRLDETTPGHGHGLAIVSNIATLYGGKIEVCDREGGGGCVCLTLAGISAQAAG